MKQIVSQPINNDKKCRNAVGIVCILAAKYRLNVRSVSLAKIEPLEERRRLTAIEIAILKMGKAL